VPDGDGSVEGRVRKSGKPIKLRKAGTDRREVEHATLGTDGVRVVDEADTGENERLSLENCAFKTQTHVD